MKTLTRITAVLFIVFALNLSAYAIHGYAAVPRLINYQGRLTDTGGSPLNGTYDLTFRIYDAEAAGNMLWQGTYAATSITKGIFSILLGDVSDSGFNFATLSFDKPYWLEIKVGSDDPMTPRQRITSSGYAIRAADVDILPRGSIILWSGSITAIPSGWALCDGTNGTPDLRDKFIAGAGRSYAVGTTGGEAAHTLTLEEIPAHNHMVVAAGAGGQWNGANSGGFNAPGPIASSSAGGGKPHNILPPYYALAFIMKL